MAVCQAVISVNDTSVTSKPQRFNILVNSCTDVPKILCDATTWSPAEHNPITQAKMADMPLAVATHCSAPSIAANLSWNAVTVGLVKRE